MLGEKNSPTAEQSHIISSPLSPRLVIAGAGSGKTATMADRVVWLVANGWVRPEEVLGVTFTRKAAGELATRIRAKLAALQRIAAADTQNQVFPAGLLSTDALEPKVSTYHSYASGIVSDYGLRLGVERDVVLLGGAQSFQLASEVVEAFDGDYEHFRSAKSTLVKAVIQLAGECAEHLQDPSGVRGWLLDRVAEFESLPYVATAKKNPSQAAAELSGMLRTRASVAEMVGRYTDAKRARGALDFGDLVALAARVANQIPVAAETERQKYKVVLLDEFQDTSHAQLVLFSRLFGDGHAVTAVGDPNQSIYGFRGASAGQLFHFVREFPVRLPGGGTAEDGDCRRRQLCPLCRGADVVPHHGVAQRPEHPCRCQRHLRTPQQGRSPDRTGRRAGHRRERRSSAAAAESGRGPGPCGDGALWHRRGRGRGDRGRRVEVPGD